MLGHVTQPSVLSKVQGTCAMIRVRHCHDSIATSAVAFSTQFARVQAHQISQHEEDAQHRIICVDQIISPP